MTTVTEPLILHQLGRRKYETLVSSFKRVCQGDLHVPISALEGLLRSNGFCVSFSEVEKIKRDRLGNRRTITLAGFLEAASICQEISNGCGMGSLASFFESYDFNATGTVSIKVFTQLMLNAGEKLTLHELESVVNEFRDQNQPDSINYRSFITALASGS